MAPPAVCECGAEEQTVDHVVPHCPIHRPPYGMHGLMVNTYPEIYSSAAQQWIERTRSNDEEEKALIFWTIRFKM